MPGKFLAVTRVPFNVAAWVGGFDLTPGMIMADAIAVSLIGGYIMDASETCYGIKEPA